ncbi:MAG: hypothetical protein QM681_14510 [Novosphingobium sp.]
MFEPLTGKYARHLAADRMPVCSDMLDCIVSEGTQALSAMSAETL